MRVSIDRRDPRAHLALATTSIWIRTFSLPVRNLTVSHGLNADLVHKWRRLAQGQLVAAVAPPTQAPTFIPLAIASPAPPPPACFETRELRIELRRGAIVATVSWSTSATAECAGWSREVLR